MYGDMPKGILGLQSGQYLLVVPTGVSDLLRQLHRLMLFVPHIQWYCIFLGVWHHSLFSRMPVWPVQKFHLA